MSARSHRTRSAALTVASALVLIGASGAVAAADPPSLDRDPCASTLAHVTIWPGTMSVGDSEVRLVSDAFDGYLHRHPSCQSVI